VTDRVIVEEMKNLWGLIDGDVDSPGQVSRITVSLTTGPDTWQTITVREPTWTDGDAGQADGFTVVIEDGGL
jgi:hypothetical protein